MKKTNDATGKIIVTKPDIGCQYYSDKMICRNIKTLILDNRKENEHGKTNNKNRFINCCNYKL